MQLEKTSQQTIHINECVQKTVYAKRLDVMSANTVVTYFTHKATQTHTHTQTAEIFRL